MKTYTNFKKIFLVRVFSFKYIFRIEFKFPILDLKLLPKTVFHLTGYATVSLLAVQLPPSEPSHEIYDTVPF